MFSKVNEHIEQNFHRYTDLLAKYVQYPSVSSDEINTPICAEFIRDLMFSMGIKARLYKFTGQPLVYGEVLSKLPASKTVLFYGHYDVQPIEPIDEWQSPPFNPEIREGRMYGRGTADNKGQHLAHILAVNSYLQIHGELPVNVKFLLEGEEEAGSIHLEDSVKKISDLLVSDIVVISDGSIHESGRPRTSFGNRGGFYLKVTVETASHDSHSGDRGGSIPNSGWELAKLLGTMMSPSGKVLIEGFYDNLLKPTPFEQKMLAELPFDIKNITEMAGIKKIYLDKDEYYMNLMYRPWLNLNSISCGEPKVVKGSIPSKSFANMDVRIVKNQTIEQVFGLIKRHIEKQDIRGKVTVERVGKHSFRPSKTDPNHPLSRRIVEVVECVMGQKAVEYPVSPGTLPTYIWEEVLKTPFVQIPYGNPDEHNHAPNENFCLNAFLQGIKTSAGIIDSFAKRK